MKKLTFVVTLEFKDKITDDIEILEVAHNIANSLEHTVNHGNGLAPQYTYTKSIEVSNDAFNVPVTKYYNYI